ncbi:MAG: hypothetical protein LN588_05990 [Rickettsia endosymbiont of Bryobia graminum]|nr:hypothetical protein [Rickettsia endosymbiont of Bryobia graminum]
MKILHLISALIISLTANLSLATEQKAQKSDTTGKPKFLFMAGSRKESVNKILALNALEIAKNLGADTTFIDLKNYPL